MSDIVETARAKLAYHQKQVAELEAFLRVYDTLSAEDKAPSLEPSITPTEKVAGNATTQKPVDKSSRRRGRKSKIRPDFVADLMAKVIREVGRPMTRGEIVQAFGFRDVEIPYEDKARYIGTIAWRHKGRFENIDGRGYWLRGEPVPMPIPPAPQLNLGN